MVFYLKPRPVVIFLVVLSFLLALRGFLITQDLNLSAAQEVTPQSVTDQIITKVSKHLSFPADAAPTVAKIVAVELLRKHNDFYNKAENGQYLIIIPNRVILYDATDDRIVDVVPVRTP